MNYQDFVNEKKALLIAPAGYGKTYTIAKAVQHTTGKQLILTHTHAGIAAIREKLKADNVKSNRYNIETISSFVQKIVHAYYVGNDIPDQDAKNYHTYLLEKAALVLSSSFVLNIIGKSYSGLFVDEYQDCNQRQHALILSLSSVLLTRILGDPLQGIFDFDGDSVNFDKDFAEFTRFPDLLIPYRWYREQNNKKLGDRLKEIRHSLILENDFTLLANDKIGLNVIEVKNNEFTSKRSDYKEKLISIIKNKKNLPELESLLILVPIYEDIRRGKKIKKGTIIDRAKIREQIDFSKSLVLLESIDDKTFYSIARKVDELIFSIKAAHKKIDRVKDILLQLFNTTEINNYFGINSLKSKRDISDRKKSSIVLDAINVFIDKPSFINLATVITQAKKQLNLKFKRDEVLYSLLNSLSKAEREKTSVFEAMKSNRNHIRRIGRKVHGKCIGTTLLTKGLEFDTVVVLDAHRFNCKKNLYVALTRCCKRLIIFTENINISFN